MTSQRRRGSARSVAGTVTDPELPMLSLDDLGVLRDVTEEGDAVTVTITPTYLGCPAMDTMRDDLEAALRAAGYLRVTVNKVLAPAWSSDWITAEGHRKLAQAGLSPPGPAPPIASGAVPLVLGQRPPSVPCPCCGSDDTAETSHFGATACKALWRCSACREPFEHVKAV